MISILIASMKEEKTIGKCIETFINGYDGEFEILVSIPDQPTVDALMQKATKLGIKDKIKRSPLSLDGKPKGKPKELNALMDMAQGDIWFFGDGDTYFDKDTIDLMLKHFQNPEVQAVTGRPVSSDDKHTKMGYFSHLLADAAHHKRTVDLTDATGRSTKVVKKRGFFPLSGYLFAMRASDIRAPEDTLVEDAYISYKIHNSGGQIDYEPEAKVYVKYPTNMKDWYKQRKRTVGGYVQLWKYGVVNKENKSRSFWRELEYVWFPIAYAKSIKQFWWSLQMYPIRLWLWMRIYWERKVLKKDFFSTWVRIESTK